MINNSMDGLAYVAVNVVHADVGPRNGYGKNDVGLSAVSYETLYFNSMPRPVTVTDRVGLRHTLPANRSFTNSIAFTVRVIYTIKRYGPGNQDYRNECIAMINSIPGTIPVELQFIRTARENNGPSSNEDLVVGVDYVVTEKELMDNNGSIYIPACDKVVSLYDIMKSPGHPFTEGTVSEKQYTDTLGKDHRGWAFGIGIALVSRDQAALPMYANVLGKIQTIPVSNGKGKREGLYITELVRTLQHSGNDEMQLVTTYHDFKDAKKLGIYRSKAEASANGDITTSREAIISEQKYHTALETGKMQKEAAEAKLELERETNEHKRRMQTMELDMRQQDHDHKLEIHSVKLEKETSDRVYEEQLREKEATNRTMRERHEFDMRRLTEQAERDKKDYEERVRRDKAAHEAAMTYAEGVAAEKERLHKLEMNRLAQESAKSSNQAGFIQDNYKLIIAGLGLIGVIYKFTKQGK